MSTRPPAPTPPEIFDLARARLRRARLGDAAAIFEYGSDPEVARYSDWPLRTSLEPLIESLQGREAQWGEGGDFNWVITLPPDDLAIGSVSCSVTDHSAEFGFVLNRRYWGNGYASEVAVAIVEWVFSVPSIWRLSATCDAENLASARVLEKAGLTHEGTLRGAIVRPNLCDQPRDAYLYAKVRA